MSFGYFIGFISRVELISSPLGYSVPSHHFLPTTRTIFWPEEIQFTRIRRGVLPSSFTGLNIRYCSGVYRAVVSHEKEQSVAHNERSDFVRAESGQTIERGREASGTRKKEREVASLFVMTIYLGLQGNIAKGVPKVSASSRARAAVSFVGDSSSERKRREEGRERDAASPPPLFLSLARIKREILNKTGCY